jgi:transcriptional regulator with XRE-family HTH domain
MTRFARFATKPRFDRHDLTRRRELGELLRRFRSQAGLSPAAVALTLGYKQQSDISNIEKAKRIPDPIELENFARLYGKSLNDFATWHKDQPSTTELLQRAERNQDEALRFQRRYYKKRNAGQEPKTSAAPDAPSAGPESN